MLAILMDFVEPSISNNPSLSRQPEVSLANSRVLPQRFSHGDNQSLSGRRSRGRYFTQNSSADVGQNRAVLGEEIYSPNFSSESQHCKARDCGSRNGRPKSRSSKVRMEQFKGRSGSHLCNTDEHEVDSSSGQPTYVVHPVRLMVPRKESASDLGLQADNEVALMVQTQRRQRHSTVFSGYDGDSEDSTDQGITVTRSTKRQNRQSSSKTSLAGQTSTFDDDGGQLLHSSQMIRGRGSAADKGMRTLLIYRAVLFGALCALAADTSCVFENELGRRVVQIL